ncbi:hypothetical protein N2152v2_000957 [Parachlorella kessleri]
MQEGLGALTSLEHLKLSIRDITQLSEDEDVQLPPLPALTCLELDDTQVPVQLAGLPALAELRLEGGDGSADLLASEPAPQLRHLSCRVAELSVDLEMLPGLTAACFAPYTHLDGPASIEAATALARLELWDIERHASSALELLCSLPPTLTSLALQGDWPAEAAEVMGQMTGLAALALGNSWEKELKAPPAEAPDWAGLRAFGWSVNGMYGDELNLPQGLRQASRLEALQCHMWRYTMEDTELLCSLPALRKLILTTAFLRLDGDEGRAALVASEPAPQLRHLVGLAGRLSADFSALPGLGYAALNARQQLDQPASLAAATALTCLELYDSVTYRDYDWDLKLLQSLPPAVSCLRLHGDWPPETILLLEEMKGLRALALDYWDPKNTLLPPVGALLWNRLRAFSWSCCKMYAERYNLPQGLRRSSQLEALQACLVKPNTQDMELITSLPGLRKVVIAHDNEDLDDPHCADARSIVQRALPHVALVEDEVLESLDFFEWAFA